MYKKKVDANHQTNKHLSSSQDITDFQHRRNQKHLFTCQGWPDITPKSSLPGKSQTQAVILLDSQGCFYIVDCII
jgi:hypothetical protein